MKQQWLDNLKKTNPAKYKKIMSHLRKTQWYIICYLVYNFFILSQVKRLNIS